MRLFGDKTKLRGAAAGMLLGAVTLSACLAGCADEGTDDHSTIADGSSGGKPDLPIRAAAGTAVMRSNGGASGIASPAAGSSAPGSDAETQPPTRNQTCTEAAQCGSGFCVDGVCCNQECIGTCVSCNQAQSPGTCLPVVDAEDESASAPCTGANICTVSADGQTACKFKSRQICSANAECASGSCGSISSHPIRPIRMAPATRTSAASNRRPLRWGPPRRRLRPPEEGARTLIGRA